MKRLFPRRFKAYQEAAGARIILPADSHLHRLIRWITLLGGLAVFLWLAPEDNNLAIVTLLGTALSALLVLRWLFNRLRGQSVTPRSFFLALTLSGALTGLGSALLTALLMLVKDGQHSHLYPDFPLLLLTAVLARAPVWMLAGALTGAGIALIVLARLPAPPSD